MFHLQITCFVSSEVYARNNLSLVIFDGLDTAYFMLKELARLLAFPVEKVLSGEMIIDEVNENHIEGCNLIFVHDPLPEEADLKPEQRTEEMIEEKIEEKVEEKTESAEG